MIRRKNYKHHPRTFSNCFIFVMKYFKEIIKLNLRKQMFKTLKAKINSKGEVELLEPIKLKKESNAILTILEDEIGAGETDTNELIILNEKSLSEDWNSKSDSRWDTILK